MIEITASAGQVLGMPPEDFLRDVWQKRPLLIRRALPDFSSPISPDELAGLSCEEGTLSRLIVHDAASDEWQVRSGPLPENVFANLPESDWTLLVQDVDKWDEDVAPLLAHFRFLPGWRLDDIMVSFAAPDGSVGAHVDQYDVFLLQGLGRRRWQIDAGENPPQDFREDVELKLLRQFNPTHEWVLEPGDMLYLPPGVPHHGVALDPCLTLSVGMRAPSHAELLVDLADTLAERLPESLRYHDPDLDLASADGRIDAAVLRRARAALASFQQIDDAALADWFAAFVTRYRSAGQIMPPPRPPSPAQMEKRLHAGAGLHLHPLARCAWHAAGNSAALFIDGERFDTSPRLSQHLSQRLSIDAAFYENLTQEERERVQQLAKRGILALSHA